MVRKKQTPFRILVIEDDRGLNRLVQKILESEGYATEGCHTGKEALEWMEREEFDLLMAEYVLADMSAKELLMKIILLDRIVPFVIMTGYGDEQVAVDMMKMGARDYLVKGPDFLNFLPAKINKVVAGIRTEQKLFRSRIALRESEQRLSRILDSMDDLVMICNAEGRVEYANRALKESLGEEITGRNCYAALYGFNKPCAWCRKDKKELRNGEIRLPHNGRHYQWSSTPIELAGGHTSRLNIFRDVTDLIKAREEIRASEEKYRILTETSNNLIWQADRDLNITYLSPSVEKIFGYKPEELTGKNVTDILAGEEIKKLRTISEEITSSSGEPAVMNFEVTSANRPGKRIPMEVYARALFGDDGQIVGFQGTGCDITDRKKAEKAEQINLDRLQSLLKITEMKSASAFDILDATLEEAVRLTESKMGYICLYDEQKKEFTLNSWSKDVMQQCTVMKKKTRYHLEKTGLWGEAVRQRRPVITNDYKAANPLKKGTPEGHVPMVRHMNLPVFWDDRIVAVVGVANKETDYDEADVVLLQLLMDTVWKMKERKVQEEELKQAKKWSEQSYRLKTRFLANMSHELRTPLNAIMGFSALMKEARSQDEMLEFAGIIYQSGEKLLELIDNLFFLSAYESGNLEVNPVDFNAADLLREIAREQKLVREKEKEGRVSLFLDIPAEVEDAVMCQDLPKLRLVLVQLVKNGFIFTCEGYVKLSLERKDPETLLFRVEDTGIGIRPEKQEIIFEKFRQTDESNTRMFDGPGMGLYIARSLVEMMGGKINVESVPGEGSVFTVQLPVRYDQAGEEKVVAKSTSVQEKPTILVVDDEADNAAFLEILLRREGVDVEVAANGKEAVEKVRNGRRFHMVLMDLKMPVMDGLEATRRIKETHPDIPVIAQSAFVASEEKKEAREAGCDAFLIKPINPEALKKLMNVFGMRGN